MNVDCLVVGHGLAGATLTWYLRWLGQRVAVVDQESPHSASRVATGLITPITGSRDSVSHRFQEFWAEAEVFYRRVEEQTGATCLVPSKTLKLVSDETKVRLRSRQACQRYLSRDVELASPYRSGTGIALRDASRIDIPTFLNASRQSLLQEHRFFDAAIQVDSDIKHTLGAIHVAKLDVVARCVVFCQGVSAESNPHFGPLPFEPAKGEILELEVPELRGRPTLLSDIWIVPTSDGRCFVGATYQREFQSPEPTDAGRAYLLDKFSELCEARGERIGHRAAVRPVMRGRLPQFGSDVKTRLGFFNGLGSKGALRAPMAAQQFARYLVHGEQVDEEFWYELGKHGKSPRRLTTVAQQIVADIVQTGDVVLDATAGNGHDTLFLSKAVGGDGRVFAIDIQEEAIRRTRAKLDANDCRNVQLIQASHADLPHIVPTKEHGSVAAVMLNLGYLPRGDQEITTHAATTLHALEHSIELLKLGGVVTIVAYPGHPDGYVEALAIEHWTSSAGKRMDCTIDRPPTKVNSRRPRLYVIRKTSVTNSGGT